MRTLSAREVSMTGTRAPSTMPAASALREKGQVLGEHVAGFEIRHDQNLARPATGRLDAFDARRFRADGVVEGERTIELAARDLVRDRPSCRVRRPRWSRECSGSTVSTADRMATFGVPKPKGGIKVDGVLDDVALGREIGRDVDRGIGDEQCLRMVRHVHDEDVADASAGAQARIALRDGPEQLIGMQASLHQQVRLRPLRTISTALSAAAWLCGTSTISMPCSLRSM